MKACLEGAQAEKNGLCAFFMWLMCGRKPIIDIEIKKIASKGIYAEKNHF